MEYSYQAFGIPIFSEIELNALAIANKPENNNSPIFIKKGKCPENLIKPQTGNLKDCLINSDEFLMEIPGTVKFYVSNGNSIIIEFLSNNHNSILLNFYSNCLSTVLLQRNLFVLHVSGVFIKSDEVLLMAAPSFTGKSTTALKMEEMGYPLFTDDWALLHIENNKCYATASFPLSRLWSNAIENQTIYDKNKKIIVYADTVEKYGFSFHERFVDKKIPVKGIAFLEEKGKTIKIKKISTAQQLALTGMNVFRNERVLACNKEHLMFKHIIEITKFLNAWHCVRPKDTDTHSIFAKSIIDKVLNN